MDHDPKYDVEASSTAGDVEITLLEKPQDAVISGQSSAGDVTILMKKIKT